VIAIHDGDAGTSGFPNLALMKISAHFKRLGERVEWYQPLGEYERVYSSAVFTFSKKDTWIPSNAIQGGTGYGVYKDLPPEIDNEEPDYSIYDVPYAVGFLTRGCPNKCSWCVVPRKEGDIRPYRTWDQIKRPDCRDIVFMDNNVLASEHGIEELESLAYARHGNLRVRIDFNQGLDARKIDKRIARLLANVAWVRFVRLACDTKAQIPYLEQAVAYMKESGVNKSSFFCYVLVKDVPDALERVTFLRGIGVEPFAQPFRDFSGNGEADVEAKAFARWVNHKAVFRSTSWEDYRDRRRLKPVETTI
jgi:hypothetical protein